MQTRHSTFLILFFLATAAFAQKTYLYMTAYPVDGLTESTLPQAHVAPLAHR